MSEISGILDKTKPENGPKVSKTGFFFISAYEITRNFRITTRNPPPKIKPLSSTLLESELGKIHSAIPWEALVKGLDLTESRKGPDSIFSPKGKVAQMFLKHYTCCSDQRLIEQLNSNIDYQFFCDLHLGLHRLSNYKIVSQMRWELASKLDIPNTEKAFYSYWKEYIDEPEKLTTDATCYESEVRYPTNQKLLWESVEWLHKQIRQL